MSPEITLAIIGAIATAIGASQKYQFGKMSARLTAVIERNAELQIEINELKARHDMAITALEKENHRLVIKVEQLYEQLAKANKRGIF